ncbi:hypothetical protein WJX74_004678 [Apatococcus lobatus]|uniref:Uncharacterized protein n=1 Tax=Apatococcus lobatus TaxID=904363 RepID=A0AAW1QYF6_9CHLO
MKMRNDLLKRLTISSFSIIKAYGEAKARIKRGKTSQESLEQGDSGERPLGGSRCGCGSCCHLHLHLLCSPETIQSARRDATSGMSTAERQ